MNYLLAVSGGVDSVVMLDILAVNNKRQDKPSTKYHLPNTKLVIAHVDHGIRPESSEDARFVEALARQYGVPYVGCRLELGEGASEEQARQARYQFLNEQSDKFRAKIVTAHHEDDLIGSIAINLIRGTGWRGLNVMSRNNVTRPLLGWTKRQVYDYALKARLEWVEDSSNSSPKYLRNRLRADVINLPGETRTKLRQLRYAQKQLACEIDTLSAAAITHGAGSRYFYTMIEAPVAVELLRSEIAQQTTQRPTSQAAARALAAIKTAKSGTRHEISGSLSLRFDKRSFIVEDYLEMVE